MPDFAGLEQQLLTWLLASLRPGSALLAAPHFGARAAPLQLRFVLALSIGIAGTATAGFQLPADGIVSVGGFLVIAAEIIVGLAMGFAVQTGYAAALLAGELISNAMGLGFAAMADPVGGQMSPAVGQFLSMLALALFLATDGHLVFAQLVIESYRALPPGQAWLDAQSIFGVVQFGALVFAAGLSIALPVGLAVILVQLAMALVARSTPQLNIFAVGTPVALMAGLVLLAMAVPVMADALRAALEAGLDQAAHIAAD